MKREEKNKILQDIIQEIQDVVNPYPKDIFVWNNQVKITLSSKDGDVEITRGRFNQFIHSVAENTKEKIIKLIEDMKE